MVCGLEQCPNYSNITSVISLQSITFINQIQTHITQFSSLFALHKVKKYTCHCANPAILEPKLRKQTAQQITMQFTAYTGKSYKYGSAKVVMF